MTTPEQETGPSKDHEKPPRSSPFDNQLPLPHAENDIDDENRKQHQGEILQGKTLQVYWYIVRNNSAGVRELQKSLNISSTGTVAYQIDKLVKAGMVAKNRRDGKYYAKAEIKKGLLRFYTHVGRFVIPRFSLYLAMNILGFIGYIYFSQFYGARFTANPGSILFLLFLLFSTLIFIYESRKLWHKPPA